MRDVVVALVALGLGALSGCASAPARDLGLVPQPPSMSEEAKSTAIEQRLDARWEIVTSRFPGAVRPEVTIVQMITPGEWATTQAECLQSESFDVVAGPDGGLLSQNIPAEQQEALEVAMFLCEGRYRIDPTFHQPLTDEEFEYYSRYLTEVVTPCLHDRGIEVPEAPSLETFIDGYASPGMWDPYENVTPTTADWARINEECPQKPPGLRE